MEKTSLLNWSRWWEGVGRRSKVFELSDGGRSEMSMVWMLRLDSTSFKYGGRAPNTRIVAVDLFVLGRVQKRVFARARRKPQGEVTHYLVL